MEFYGNINKLRIENFRVFIKETEFEFSPLTILTGTNNSGKSALQKLFFLIKSTYLFDKQNSTLEELVFTDEVIHHMDFFENNISYSSSTNEIKLVFVIKDEICNNITVTLLYIKSEKSQNGVLQEVFISMQEEVIIRYRAPFVDPILNEWTSDIPDDGIHKFYQILINEKKRFLEEYSVYKIYERLLEKKPLTKNELNIKSDLESKGYLFFDERAKELVNNDDYNFSGSVIPVWNENHNCPMAITGSLKKKWELYHDLDLRILIPTLLSDIALAKVDFFGRILDNEQEEIIRNLLIRNDVLNIETFIESYRSLEKGLIRAFIDYDAPLGMEMPGDPPSWRRAKFKDFFAAGPQSDSNLLSNCLIQLAENNPIAKILSCDEYENIYNIDLKTVKVQKDPFSTIFEFKVGPPKDHSQEILNIIRLLDSYHDKTRTLIGQLNQNLSSLAENLIFVSTRTSIKNYYFFGDSKIGDQAFIQFGKNVLTKDTNFEKQISFCNKWLREFGISSALEIEPIMLDGNQIGLSYYLRKNDSKRLIRDSGMGVRMIISMLISMAVKSSSINKRVILFEEPEVHLHPAYQSKLADLFVDGYRTFGNNFIIETHSEYLIRKFQLLVAKKYMGIKPEEIALYYLTEQGKEKNLDGIMRRLNFRDDGILKEDFGPGFFDESTTLAIDLFNEYKSN